MSDSIAITSGKGGVGKTTFAVNLSIAQKKTIREGFFIRYGYGNGKFSCFTWYKSKIHFS